MKHLKSVAGTLFLALVLGTVGILFWSMPALSGFVFGGAFSFIVLDVLILVWGDRTIASLIPKERLLTLRPFVAVGLLVVVFFVPTALVSGSFFLGFLATPSVLASILVSGLMVIATNPEPRDLKEQEN